MLYRKLFIFLRKCTKNSEQSADTHLAVLPLPPTQGHIHLDVGLHAREGHALYGAQCFRAFRSTVQVALCCRLVALCLVIGELLHGIVSRVNVSSVIQRFIYSL